MEDTKLADLVPADRESSLAQSDKVELRVWLRLLTCANLIEKRVRAGLRESFAVTLPRFDVLAQLDRAPGGLTMGALSDRLMVSNGNVTGLIDRLVEEGLVTRLPPSQDRRQSRVELSATGKLKFDAMTPEHEGWIEDLFAELSRQEMRQLLNLLAKLKRSIATSLGDDEGDRP